MEHFLNQNFETFCSMKQDLIDHINFLARDIPHGAVNSFGLEDDVIDLYNHYCCEYTEHEIFLEHACFIATKKRIENFIEKESRLQLQTSQKHIECNQSEPIYRRKSSLPKFKQPHIPRLPVIPEMESSNLHGQHESYSDYVECAPHLDLAVPSQASLPYFLPHGQFEGSVLVKHLQQNQPLQSAHRLPPQPGHVLGSPPGQGGTHINGEALQSAHRLPPQSGHVLGSPPGQDGAYICGQSLQSAHRMPPQPGHVLGSPPSRDVAHIHGQSLQSAHRLPP